jgi:hypothetical protein
VDAALEPGGVGQFDVVVDGETIASRGGNRLTRPFGAGYPDPEDVVRALAARAPGGQPPA